MSNTANASSDAPAAPSTATVQLGIRLPAHLYEAVQAKQSAMQEAMPGATISISDAVRALLLAGLAAT